MSIQVVRKAFLTDASLSLVSGIIIALAHTWESKLPGFRQEFRKQLSVVYVQTPPKELEARTALDTIINALS